LGPPEFAREEPSPIAIAAQAQGEGKAKGASELEREVEVSLSRLGLNPAGLQLELAESVLMEATQKHSNALENLRLLGTTISAGYSPLKYLTT